MKKILNVKLIIIFVISLLCSNALIAQSKYRVTYDYKTEEIIYLEIDKNNKVVDTLDQPKIKRNSSVEVLLKHINPFAVKVKTDVKEEDYDNSGQGFNFGSLLGGINSFSGNNLNLNLSNLPDSKMFSESTQSRGQLNEAKSDFDDFSNSITNLSALKNTFISNLLNPNLDKKEILENLVNTANAKPDVRIPTSAGDNFYMYLAEAEKSITDSKSDLEQNINRLNNDIELENDSVTPTSRGELVARNMTISELQKLMVNLNDAANDSSETIEELRSLYTVLEASNFEQIYDYELTADKVNLVFKFIQSDFSKSQEDGQNEDDAAILKTRTIKLKSKGGFKLNTSVALTLNKFESSSKDFFIAENGKVGADTNDFFVPNLSTMINFYPFISESFNIGGSFGISIPISQGENINGINFLLGPSLFFGSKNRLALSGGAAYGPVKQLTNGIAVGDVTQFGNIENFTKTVYDFGYYFGISFSLFNIN